MTPERWRRVGELFAAALRVEPEGRDAWLRGACGDDERTLAEVARLLDQDGRASRDRFLSAPGSTHPAHEPTGSWSSRAGRGRRPTLRVRSTDGPRVVSVAVDRGVGDDDEGEGGSGFSPRAAIVAGSRPYAASETESIVRRGCGSCR